MQSFRPSLGSSVATFLIGIATLALFSYSQQEGEIYFNDFGAMSLAAVTLVLLVIAIVVTCTNGFLDQLPNVITPLFSAFPWVVIVLCFIAVFDDPAADSGSHWIMALIWCVAVAVRSVQLAFRSASAITLLGTAFVLSGLAYGAAHRGYYPTLFYSIDDDYSGYYEDFPYIDQEDLFVNQSQLLAGKLDKIEPERPGQTDIYFLGFAGNGDEPVFESEASFAEQRVAERYFTAGRSIVLSSSYDSLDTEPLANTHNLFNAISAIGAKMDVAEDILFVFLTSHGSKNAQIDVSLFPLDLRQLGAEELRTALDRANIEWRIVVVSACYSGSFIEPLKNERTIVITAASAQKTSFGCSRDRDLTYFGEAFFKAGLGGKTGLRDAFGQAQVSISEREASEGLSSSEPQIYVGTEIEQKIAQLEAGL